MTLGQLGRQSKNGVYADHPLEVGAVLEDVVEVSLEVDEEGCNYLKRKPNAPGSRRAKALANRRRMLRAAYELFCDGGYVGTTMTAIAERAGVAVQTLYFTFNTKSAILEEAFGAAVVGFEHWDPKVEDVVFGGDRAT